MNVFIIETPTKDMCDLVNSLFREHGYREVNHSYNMGIENGQSYSNFCPEGRKDCFVTFSEFKRLLKESAPIFVLNDEYTANINFNKKQVNVGCQSFSFAKVLELAELIKSR